LLQEASAYEVLLLVPRQPLEQRCYSVQLSFGAQTLVHEVLDVELHGTQLLVAARLQGLASSASLQSDL